MRTSTSSAWGDRCGGRRCCCKWTGGSAHGRDDDPDTDLCEEVLRGYEEEYGPRGWAPATAGLDVVLPDSVRDDPEDGARGLDRRLLALIRLRQGLAWQQGRLVSTFSTLGLHRALGFLSFGRYCRERAGLGIRRAGSSSPWTGGWWSFPICPAPTAKGRSRGSRPRPWPALTSCQFRHTLWR